jgi:predicted ATPase
MSKEDNTITIYAGDPNKLIDHCSNKGHIYFLEKTLLHPKLQTDFITKFIDEGAPYNSVLVTNSDHIINACRVARKQNRIKGLVIFFYPFNYTGVPLKIRVDKNGTLSEYPEGLLDEWANQMVQLI